MARKTQANSKVVSQQFAITVRGASSVMLVGDFTHWKEKPVRLAKKRGGVWTGTVELPPGTYHYRFLVDGQWRDDPECTCRVANPYGGENCVMNVG